MRIYAFSLKYGQEEGALLGKCSRSLPKYKGESGLKIAGSTPALLHFSDIMKVGIYARVSTKDKGQDVGSQFAQMKDYCQRKGWDTAQYQDEESGKLEAEAARAGLDRLLGDLRAGSIAGVIITDQRRFARSVELGMRLVRIVRESDKFLEIAQTGLHVDRQKYGIAEMMNLVVGFMMGEADNMQHALDVKRGIDAKKKRYSSQGRKWKWGRKQANVDPAMVMRMRHVEGKGIKAIAHELGVSTTPILRILRENAPAAQ